MKPSLIQALPLLMLLVVMPAFANPLVRPGDRVSPLDARARAVLMDVFNAEEDWASVHAAEIIVQLGYGDRIRDAMLRRMACFEEAGTRVGAWRVMAMIPGYSARNEWNLKLERVFLDPGAMDRLQALESLAKVKHPLRGAALAAAAGLAKDLADSDQVVLPLWALAASGDLRALESLVALLESGDVATRRRTAYSLRRLKPESATLRAAILRALEIEPPDTIAYPYLLCTALDLNLDPTKTRMWFEALQSFAATAAPKVKFEVLQGLADHLGPDHIAALVPQLDDTDGDVRAGAAFALLGIVGRNSVTGLQ